MLTVSPEHRETAVTICATKTRSRILTPEPVVMSK